MIFVVGALCSVALGASPPHTAFSEGGRWVPVADEDGVTVSSRQNVTGMPTFRGETLIRGGILDILAVFRDSPRHTEWMHRCKTSKVLMRYSDLEALIYNRTKAPWPVTDRDVVIRAKLVYDLEKKEAWNHFRSVRSALAPPVEDAVRMPMLRGFYHMIQLDPDRTVVVYQVESDAGGWLPHWLRRSAAKNLPLVTLRNLRRRVESTRGQYEGQINTWKERYGLVKP